MQCSFFFCRNTLLALLSLLASWRSCLSEWLQRRSEKRRKMLSSSSSSSSSSTFWSRRRELFFGSAIFGPLLQGFASTTQAVHYPIQPFREFFGSIISAIEIFAKWQSAGIWSFLPGKDFVCVHDQATSLEFFDGIPFFFLAFEKQLYYFVFVAASTPTFQRFPSIQEAK